MKMPTRAGIFAALVFVSGGASAKEPKPLPQMYFYDPPTAVLAKIAGRCMDRGLTVLEADSSHVLCGGQMSGFRGALTQVLLGNSYSTTPVVKLRFHALPTADGSRVQFSQWIETQMAFGQMRTMPLDDRKNLEQTRQSLRDLGGHDRVSETVAVPNAAGSLATTGPARAAVAESPGTIVLNERVKLVPADTLSGYCIKAAPGYVGTGSVSAPAATKAKPLCT